MLFGRASLLKINSNKAPHLMKINALLNRLQPPAKGNQLREPIKIGETNGQFKVRQFACLRRYTHIHRVTEPRHTKAELYT